MILLYEETKYDAVEVILPAAEPCLDEKNCTTNSSIEEQQRQTMKKSYWERLALVTKTDDPFW